MITGKEIFLNYGNTAILKNISFELKEGSITTLCGPSGGGKTSLLKCLAHLLSHYEGGIFYKEQNLKRLSAPERASVIGFVLQQYHLFPHLSVLDNCTYALVAVLKLKREEAQERALEMLHLLNMGAFAKAFPAQLSGGQQQRVALARALVLRPKVLLLDEPTAALDPDNKKNLEMLLRTLKSQGITIALSSHDIPFAQQIADETYVMEQGQLFKEKI